MTEITGTNTPAPAMRVLERIAQALLALTTALMLMVVALIVAQVAARNIWHVGLPRAEELSRLGGVLAVYLTAPVLAIRGQHVAVDVFTGIMPRLPRLLCALLAELSVLAFSALSIWGGWLYLQRAWKFRTPALGLHNIWLFAPVMIAFALLALIAICRFNALLRGTEVRR